MNFKKCKKCPAWIEKSCDKLEPRYCKDCKQQKRPCAWCDCDGGQRRMKIFETEEMAAAIKREMMEKY